MLQPLIGITTYERNEHQDFVLPAVYVDAVRRAGGIPVLVPPGEEQLLPLLDRLDGVIFSGGMDIDPSCYGGIRHPQVEASNAERDATEIALIRQVAQLPLPTLCICRGAQVLNVALGGSLIEHLPDVVGNGVLHQTLTPGERGYPDPIVHAVEVDPASQLAKILGSTQIHPASWHHQAVRQVAEGLLPVAFASDGTIEALELRRHPWLIGVQWHPEMTAATDPQQQHLFDAFILAAQAYRTSS